MERKAGRRARSGGDAPGMRGLQMEARLDGDGELQAVTTVTVRSGPFDGLALALRFARRKLGGSCLDDVGGVVGDD